MLHFVILCGGSGSRLWPKSREKLPKQLLALTDAHHTMLQNTLFRIQKVFQKLDANQKREITILCNQEHGHIVELQVKELAETLDASIPINVICEPKGRDSAPAICIAALLKDLSAYTFILPCDHVFNDEEFANCCVAPTPALML
jgi:mannose-1-phosphate guanylyltransferase